ncbi:MAG: HlyC/CorC family transporter [Phycisphaerales bacterium]|nr:HlyC/CorC family transporter [Phycisphaerales bacterium]
MPPEAFPLIIAMLCLMLASAVCSGTETALFRLSGADRALIARSHPASGRALERLLGDPRGLLVTILLLNNTVNVAFFLLSSLLAVRMEGATATAIAGTASFFALTLVGEVLPKLVVGPARVPVATVVAPPLLALFQVLNPVRRVLDGFIVAPLAELVRPAHRGHGPSVTSDELTALIEVASARGSVGEHEEEILGAVVELHERRVREAMTHRTDIHWLDEATTGEVEILETVRRTGVHTYLVCRGSLDAGVVGVLDALTYMRERERLRALGKRHDPPISVAISKPHFVPENTRLDRLLQVFRDRGSRFAICVDERGVIQGVVTLGDVVRFMTSSGSAPGERPREVVSQVGPGSWRVPGGLPVRDWADFFGHDDGEPDIDQRVTTIAGLVVARLGRLPRVGDCVRVGNLDLHVGAMDGRRIEHVLVSLAPEAEDAP